MPTPGLHRRCVCLANNRWQPKAVRCAAHGRHAHRVGSAKSPAPFGAAYAKRAFTPVCSTGYWHARSPVGAGDRFCPRGTILTARGGNGAQHKSFSRRIRARALQRTARNFSSRQRGEAERRQAHQPLSAPRIQALPRCGRGSAPSGARSPLGATPRHSPRLLPLGSAPGRASWNYRVQTGGPSPAPVQRAPRGPVCVPVGTMPGAARERSVSFRPRAPLSLRLQEHPHDGVPRMSEIRDSPRIVTERETDVKGRHHDGDHNPLPFRRLIAFRPRRFFQFLEFAAILSR
jgi:hypothetical protein